MASEGGPSAEEGSSVMAEAGGGSESEDSRTKGDVSEDYTRQENQVKVVCSVMGCHLLIVE